MLQDLERGLGVSPIFQAEGSKIATKTLWGK
jgi:hypothetical protein